MIYMDRMQLETASDFASGSAVARYRRLFREDPPVTFSVAVNLCENCRQSCEQLFPVPEYDLAMCETCRDEAQVELAREAADAVPSKPVARWQGNLFTEVA
jgi:hypothetical protein